MSVLEKKILFVIKIAFIVIPFGIFFWLVNQNYALTGHVKYVFTPDKFKPDQLILLSQLDAVKGIFQTDGKIHWLAADNNLKFTVKLLRNFEKLKVKLSFNNISQPTVYLDSQSGVAGISSHDVIVSQILNQLNWPYLQKENHALQQRPSAEKNDKGQIARTVRQYQSIDEFITDTPRADKIGLIGLSGDSFVQFIDYNNDQGQRTIDHYLRGQHTVYFYKNEEPINLSFNKIDLNRQTRPGELKLNLYLGSDLRYSLTVPDDGDIRGDNKIGHEQLVNINLPDLGKGIYRLEINTNEDVIFGNIKTNLKYLYFSGRVFLADGPTYFPNGQFQTLTLMTDASSLSFSTPHLDGIHQNITIGHSPKTIFKTVEIKNADEYYNVFDLKGKNYLNIPRNDFGVSGGNFVFPGFEMAPKYYAPSVDEAVAKNIDNLDYVLSQSIPKETFGDILFEKDYDVSKLININGLIYFNIYSPGLYNSKNQLELKSIEMDFSGQALTGGKMWEKAKDLFHRLTHK